MFVSTVSRLTVMVAVLVAAISSEFAVAGNPPLSFSYQGYVTKNGVPVNEPIAETRFRLYDAPVGGNLIDSLLSVNITPVDGVFTTSIAFPSFDINPFDAYWLEIEMDGDVLGRQQILATPYSLHTRGLDVDLSGNVGIAQRTPEERLEIGTFGSGPNYVKLNARPGEMTGIKFRVFNDEFGMTVQNVDGLGLEVLRHVGDTQGERAVLIDRATGNVGIGNGGTFWPVTIGSGDAEYGMVHRNLGHDVAIGTFVDANSAQIGTLTPNDLRFFTDEGEPDITLDVDGNIGIGTTSPDAGVEIQDRWVSIRNWGESVDGSQIRIGFPVSEDVGMSFDRGNGAGGFSARWYTIVSEDSKFRIAPPSVNYDHLVICPSGNVGIGTETPSATLEVDGTAAKPGGGSWSTASDVRLKKNISAIKRPLDTLLSLRGVRFEYTDPTSIGEPEGVRTGFIAQDVERVIPDWVWEGDDGFKRLGIRGFEAMAVEAMRELRDENEELQERVDRLELLVQSMLNVSDGE